MAADLFAVREDRLAFAGATGDVRRASELLAQEFGKCARRHARGLRKHHRCIGGHIAMGRFTWRLGNNARQVEPGRDQAIRGEVLEGLLHEAMKMRKEIHLGSLNI